MNMLRSRSSLFGVYMLHNEKEMQDIKISDLQERVRVGEEENVKIKIENHNLKKDL